MKNNKKQYGIIAIMVLIMFSMVLLSCGQSISGTFSYREDMSDYFITFKGKNFVGMWEGEDIAGTFSVVDNRIILDLKWDTIVIHIVDKDTLRDPDGDLWKRRR